MPELADRLFVWPNCIDPAIYKTTASSEHPHPADRQQDALYHAQRVTRILISRYPALNCRIRATSPTRFAAWSCAANVCAHDHASALCQPAHRRQGGREEALRGFSLPVVPGDGAVARIGAAGFEDMKNCVFAEPRDIVDKLDYLLSNPTNSSV